MSIFTYISLINLIKYNEIKKKYLNNRFNNFRIFINMKVYAFYLKNKKRFNNSQLYKYI